MRTKEKDEAVAKVPLINDELRNPVYRGELEGLSVYTFEAKVRLGVFVSPPRLIVVTIGNDLIVRRAKGVTLMSAEEKFNLGKCY